MAAVSRGYTTSVDIQNALRITTATRSESHITRVPGEIKNREVELDPQPRRDHEQGGGAGL